MRNAVEDTGTMCRAPLIFRFCFYTIRYSVKTYLQIHTLQLFFSAHEAPPVLRAQTLCDEVCGQPVKRVEHPFLLPSIYIQRGGVSILRFLAILGSYIGDARPHDRGAMSGRDPRVRRRFGSPCCGYTYHLLHTLPLTTCYSLLISTYSREEGLGLAPVREPVAVQVKVDVEPKVGRFASHCILTAYYVLLLTPARCRGRALTTDCLLLAHDFHTTLLLTSARCRGRACHLSCAASMRAASRVAPGVITR